MRNALAHAGDNALHFTPISEKDADIESVIFYDTKTRNEKTYEFCVEIEIEEIRKLGIAIAKMYSAIEKKAGGQRDYGKQVSERRKLMKRASNLDKRMNSM